LRIHQVESRRRRHELGPYRVGDPLAQHAVYLGLDVSLERPAVYFGDRCKLVGMARAPQRSCDALVQHPAHREMDDALAVAVLREQIQPLYGAQILVEAWRLEFRVVPAQVIAAELRVGPHPAREQPATERPVAQNGDVVPAAIRQDFLLDAALEKVVGRLQNMQRRDVPESVYLRDREIAHPDGADLSLVI